MKKRFKNILDIKSKKSGTTLLIMALLLIFLSSGLVACTRDEVNSDGNFANNGSNDYDTNYYLNRNESVLFQEASLKFAKAYFSSDKDEIKEYLADGVEPEVWEKDVYNELSRLVLKWNPEELATDKVMDVQYEFLIEGEDSSSYLQMILEYQNDKWIVQEYYLEK